jgi:hypothetical protein
MTWVLDRRYLVAGAVVLWTIWAVECLRKGGFIWPWPLVPLAIWAGYHWYARRQNTEAKA